MRFDRAVTAATGVGLADGRVQVGDSVLRVPGLAAEAGTAYRLLLANGAVVSLLGTPGPPGPPGPGGTTAVDYLWGGTNAAVDPGAGYVRVAGQGNQPRTIAVNKVDADGVTRNLALIQVGDTLLITDDPDTPPITGFARYVVTEPPIDHGAWWSAVAIRTDTSGTAQPPPVGTRLRLSGYLTDTGHPVRQWSAILGNDSGQIGPGYQNLAQVTVPVVAGGVYEVTFQGRFRVASGANPIFVHLRSPGDIAVSAIVGNVTAQTVSVMAVVTAAATASRQFYAGMSTGGGTANLVAGPTFPAPLLVKRID